MDSNELINIMNTRMAEEEKYAARKKDMLKEEDVQAVPTVADASGQQFLKNSSEPLVQTIPLVQTVQVQENQINS